MGIMGIMGIRGFIVREMAWLGAEIDRAVWWRIMGSGGRNRAYAKRRLGQTGA